MKTLSHLVFNLLAVDQARLIYRWPHWLNVASEPAKLPLTPVIWGSLLPDLPMVIFYGVEKFLWGQSEAYIWGTAYFQSHWTNFIDLFNSIPIIALGFGLSYWQQSRWGWFFFAAMFLHVLGDLPLHHDDGHHHFFPFSNWRFDSPISYWDRNHHGGIVSVIEAIAALLSFGYLFWRYPSRWGKVSMGIFFLLEALWFIGLFRVF